MADYLPPDYRRPRYRRASPLRQSTSALTVKLVLFAVICTLAIGGLIASEMASGSDPALGPKAVAQAKKSAAKSRASNSSSSSGSGSGTDPYSQAYGGEGGYYYGDGSSGYSSGSGSAYSAPPVTSSTS